MLAISVDPPNRAAQVVEKNHLPFPVLCDESREVTRAFGVVHEHGGPASKDVPLPAMFLLGTDGVVRWQRVATMAQDRPDPNEVLKIIDTTLR